MVPYKSKLMHVEDDILNFSSIRQNRNYYPREDNNCGEDSSMTVLIDDDHLCEAIIDGTKDIRVHKILESRDSVLSSVQIGDAKCRVYSRKIETYTIITIKIKEKSEKIKSNTIFGFYWGWSSN